MAPELAAALAAAPLPEVWRRRLVRVYRELDGPVAVRSSLVGEDGEQASLAGQLASVLDVSDETALLDAVRCCWASAFSPRLLEYRRGLQTRRGLRVAGGVDGESWPAMGLIVQLMQPAVAGGVAFSADPLSGRRCVIVEAAGGRADGVAGGTVTPARWVVDARGEIADQWLADGAPPPLEAAAVLTLAAAMRRIEAAWGRPVDVEWLHDGARFWFLQARPITTLLGKRIYSNRLVADMSPGLVKPLLWSTNTQAITRNVFARLFTELIGPSDVDYSRLVRRIHSRLYADVTLLGELLVAIGLPANFFEMMARDERGERPRLARRSMLPLLRYVPFLWRHLRAESALRRFVAAQDAELAPCAVPTGRRLRSPSCARPPNACSRCTAARSGRLLAAFNLMVRKRLLERSLRPAAPEVRARDLLQGHASLKALEPNEVLQSAGRAARALSAEQLRLLDDGDDAHIRAALATSEAGRGLLAAIDAFMARYGFLSANGTDFSAASWIEQPALIWRSVARNARAAEMNGVPDRRARGQTAVVAVEARLSPLRRHVFRRFLASTHRYLDLRERASFLFSEDTFQFRRVILAMGEQLWRPASSTRATTFSTCSRTSCGSSSTAR